MMIADDSGGSGLRGGASGTLSVATGVVALGLTAFLGITSFTEFNPPEWVRMVGLLLLPVGLAATGVLGALGWRGEGRARAVVGLTLGAVALAACAIMITMGER